MLIRLIASGFYFELHSNPRVETRGYNMAAPPLLVSPVIVKGPKLPLSRGEKDVKTVAHRFSRQGVCFIMLSMKRNPYEQNSNVYKAPFVIIIIGRPYYLTIRTITLLQHGLLYPSTNIHTLIRPIASGFYFELDSNPPG